MMLEHQSWRQRQFDKSLLTGSGFLEKRILEPVPNCWFCSESKTLDTREHVFPKWMLDKYGLENQLIEPVRYTSDLTTIGSKRNPYPLRALRLKNVCSKCNNGWMSLLESNVQQVFSRNQSGRISHHNAELLSRWFAKTAVALNVSMPYRLMFDEKTRHQLAVGIPDSIQVFIYKFQRKRNEINWQQGDIVSWFAPNEIMDLIRDAMPITYVSHINTPFLSGLVINFPQSIGGLNPRVETDASQIWPPSHLPTWGGIAHVKDRSKPSPTVYVDEL